jgi:hypothetical protein
MRTNPASTVLAAFLLATLAPLAPPVAAQETPPSVVASYEALADTILAVRRAEGALVRSLLDGHRHAAEALEAQGDWSGVAAQVALFGNEGDNAIGGVRKRLREGGHFYNASGEAQGLYEEGYVVVTKEAKKRILDLARAIRTASGDADREKAWGEFVKIADGLLAKK